MGNEAGVLARARGAWQRARARWWVRWGVDLLVLALIALGVMAWQTRNLPGGGEPAPDFALRTLSGEQVRLADLKGKPVLLVFWAPWCGVCKTESPTLSSLREWVGERAHVVSVALSYEDEEDVRRYVREQEVDYLVLLGNEATRRAYRVNMYPTTFVLSAEGRIEQSAVGYTTKLGLLWRLWRAS